MLDIGLRHISRELHLSKWSIKSVYSLGFGTVKQTVNTPTVIDRLAKRANVNMAIIVGFMRKQIQYLFLSENREFN
jgi:hypothetical protein